MLIFAISLFFVMSTIAYGLEDNGQYHKCHKTLSLISWHLYIEIKAVKMNVLILQLIF